MGRVFHPNSLTRHVVLGAAARACSRFMPSDTTTYITPWLGKRRKMPIREHPPAGTILICDFQTDFRLPEMVKIRPVVVVSPKISGRPGLCTVVALSTTPPNPKMPFHAEISINPRLPPPWDAESMWVKGDMIYAIGFHRLDLVRLGKDHAGKQIYRFATLTNDQIILVRKLVLRSIGLSQLTKHM